MGNQEATGTAAARLTWSPWAVLGILMRCAIVTVVLTAGMGGLAHLSATERVATSRLQVPADGLAYAVYVGVVCIPPFAIAAMIAELQLAILRSSGWSWRFCQLLLPLTFATLVALFSWFVFRPAEHGPKETMLVAGGAVMGFLANGLHLGLWHSSHGPSAGEDDFPSAWYFLLIVLMATFLGAMKGWTGPNVYYVDLERYRQAQWTDEPRPIQGEPVEAPPAW